MSLIKKIEYKSRQSIDKELYAKGWNACADEINEYIDKVTERLEKCKSNDGLPADVVWNNALKLAIDIVRGDY